MERPPGDDKAASLNVRNEPGDFLATNLKRCEPQDTCFGLGLPQ